MFRLSVVGRWSFQEKVDQAVICPHQQFDQEVFMGLSLSSKLSSQDRLTNPRLFHVSYS